jgi:hypothetical protein
MHQSLRKPALVLALFLAVGIGALAQRGALTLPFDLSQMTARSQRIVRGRVASARVEKHPQYKNLNTVVVTFQVEESLKGAPASTITFRQFLWDLRDLEDAAGYRRGQELLLFLHPVSAAGLTSPAGLEQGRFRVLRDAAGRATVVNGRGNAGLLGEAERSAASRLPAAARQLVLQHTDGPIALETFRQMVEEIQRSRQE